MINTFVFFHLLRAGLHFRMHLIILSRSVLFGETAPHEWIVVPIDTGWSGQWDG